MANILIDEFEESSPNNGEIMRLQAVTRVLYRSDADYILAGTSLNSDPRNSESSYHR